MITDFYLPLFFGLIHIRAYQSEADNHFFYYGYVRMFVRFRICRLLRKAKQS